MNKLSQMVASASDEAAIRWNLYYIQILDFVNSLRLTVFKPCFLENFFTYNYTCV